HDALPILSLLETYLNCLFLSVPCWRLGRRSRMLLRNTPAKGCQCISGVTAESLRFLPKSCASVPKKTPQVATREAWRFRLNRRFRTGGRALPKSKEYVDGTGWC